MKAIIGGGILLYVVVFKLFSFQLPAIGTLAWILWVFNGILLVLALIRAGKGDYFPLKMLLLAAASFACFAFSFRIPIAQEGQLVIAFGGLALFVITYQFAILILMLGDFVGSLTFLASMFSRRYL